MGRLSRQISRISVAVAFLAVISVLQSRFFHKSISKLQFFSKKFIYALDCSQKQESQMLFDLHLASSETSEPTSRVNKIHAGTKTQGQIYPSIELVFTKLSGYLKHVKAWLISMQTPCKEKKNRF